MLDNIEFTYNLASSFVEKGEIDRAIVTVLNGLSKSRTTINENPELIELLVSIIKSGYEDEIVRIHYGCPLDHPFIPKFCLLLENAGKNKIANEIKRCADNYLKEQRRRQQFTQSLSTNAEHTILASRTTRESCEVMHISKRFDRVTKVQTLPTPSQNIYVENGLDRAILDFDNCIPLTTASSKLNTTSITPFKSFEEDLKEAKLTDSQLNQRVKKKEIEPEFAKIQPYNVRHPKRFSVPPRLLSVLVVLCVVITFASFSWGGFQNHQQDALFNEMDNILGDGSKEDLNSILNLIQTQHTTGEQNSEILAYQDFIKSWQDEIYINDNQSINEKNKESDAKIPAAIAAHFNRLILRNDIQAAQMLKNNLDEQLFYSERHYFTWIHASLADATGDISLAAQHYDKLLNSPLAPFAATRLAKLALTTEHPLPISKFLNFMRNARNLPKQPPFTHCAHQLLEPETANDIPSENNYREPYDKYCKIATIQQSIDNKDFDTNKALDELKTYQINTPYADFVALQIFIQNEQLEQAVDLFNKIPTSKQQKHLFQKDLVKNIYNSGKIPLFTQLFEHFPKDSTTLMATRFLDLQTAFPNYKNNKVSYSWLQYLQNTKAPFPAEETTENIYLDELNTIYRLTYFGKITQAYQRITLLTTKYPTLLEPLLLRAEILTINGQHQDAIALLKDNEPLIQNNLLLKTRIALYSLRNNINLDMNDCQNLLTLQTDDPTLKAEIAEIAWRMKHPLAETMYLDLQKNSPNYRAVAYLTSQITPKDDTNEQNAILNKAYCGAFSPTELHTQKAKTALLTKNSKDFIQAASLAILIPPHNIDMPMTLAEFYKNNYRSYEGTKKLEELLQLAASLTKNELLLGNLHYAAAYLYNPANAHPNVQKHLKEAQNLLGNNENILNAYIAYYTKKNKPLKIHNYKLQLAELKRSQSDLDLVTE